MADGASLLLPLSAHCGTLAMLCHSIGEFQHRDLLLQSSLCLRDGACDNETAMEILELVVAIREYYRDEIAHRLGLTVHN